MAGQDERILGGVGGGGGGIPILQVEEGSTSGVSTTQSNRSGQHGEIISLEVYQQLQEQMDNLKMENFK